MLRDVPLPSGKPPGWTPYTYEAATKEIQQRLNHAPRGTKKKLAEVCGIDSAGFRHRMTRYRGETFTLEQFGAIAVELGAKVPWPFVPWDEAERYAAVLKLIDPAKK